MVTITLAAQLAEVKREIALRHRVYPRWVQSGKLTKQAADDALAAMDAVRQTLQRLVGEERAQVAPELF
jgi:hypothetical protein